MSVGATRTLGRRRPVSGDALSTSAMMTGKKIFACMPWSAPTASIRRGKVMDPRCAGLMNGDAAAAQLSRRGQR